MEKADVNGFVNVIWPSKNIPHGGIFHTRIVEPSTTQKQFLKVLLEESKLDIAQRQKNALGLRETNERDAQRVTRPPVQTIRPRTSRRRSLSAIREAASFDEEQYRPLKRGEDREKLKERLANTMAYGDTPDLQQQQQAAPRLRPKPERKLPTTKQMWNDLVTQIRERTEWLAEMEYLGEADQHREIIKEQIAERMRALDALGIDSSCSSARSTVSGFSTTRSREDARVQSTQPVIKSVSTTRSNKSAGKSLAQSVGKARTREENVKLYDQLSPLQYSPRRRV